MSAFSDLIADVKESCRQNTSETDSFLLNAAGRIYRNYLRLDDWPQARVTAAPIAIVSGTQFYDLPADFDRFAGPLVDYFWAASNGAPALSLPVLTRGSAMDERRISIWEAILTTGYTIPAVIAIGAGGANTYQLQLLPLAGGTGDTIAFDYYSAPSRASISTSTTIIDPLYETMVAALSAELARFRGGAAGLQEYGLFKQEQAAAHRLARMTLRRL